MRYVFIFNPIAGKKNPFETFSPKIKQFMETHNIPYTFHVTERPAHATELAGKECEAGDDVRIYGCGGDGTLCEIVNGVIGKSNAEIGIFPCGSGNDFLKVFGTEEDFLSVEKQIYAPSKYVDAIHSEQQISISLCSMGLDANVAYNMTKFKKWPLISGSMAYDLALLKVLLSKLGNELKIIIDDEKVYEGNYFFALAANGQYYGGGYRGAPEAIPDDGLLDFVIIKKTKFSKIPPLLKIYKAGEHLKSEKMKDLIIYCRGKKMQILSKIPVITNFDGECKYINDITFEVMPNAVRFIVPA